MGCWDTEPKTEEQVREQTQKMMKHPLFIKLFKIPDIQEVSEKMIENPSSRVDYLRLMGK